jgi:glutamate dehydrogenase
VGGLARDFQQMRLDALRRLGTADPQGAVEAWLAAQAAPVARFRAMIERARRAYQPCHAGPDRRAGARVLAL